MCSDQARGARISTDNHCCAMRKCRLLHKQWPRQWLTLLILIAASVSKPTLADGTTPITNAKTTPVYTVYEEMSTEVIAGILGAVGLILVGGRLWSCRNRKPRHRTPYILVCDTNR